eukprot:2720495-Rhodomonas_salina.1
MEGVPWRVGRKEGVSLYGDWGGGRQALLAAKVQPPKMYSLPLRAAAPWEDRLRGGNEAARVRSAQPALSCAGSKSNSCCWSSGEPR